MQIFSHCRKSLRVKTSKQWNGLPPLFLLVTDGVCDCGRHAKMTSSYLPICKDEGENVCRIGGTFAAPPDAVTIEDADVAWHKCIGKSAGLISS